MFPRWLSILFLVFLVYMVFNYSTTQLPASAPAPAPASNGTPPAQDYSQLRALLDGNRWKRAINPDYHADTPCGAAAPAKNTLGNFAVVQEDGAGDASACGDTLSVRIIRYDAQGRAGVPVDTHLVLGKQPALDALLVGMRPHEQRLIYVHVPASGYAALPGWKKNQPQLASFTSVIDAAGGKNVDK